MSFLDFIKADLNRKRAQAGKVFNYVRQHPTPFSLSQQQKRRIVNYPAPRFVQRANVGLRRFSSNLGNTTKRVWNQSMFNPRGQAGVQAKQYRAGLPTFSNNEARAKLKALFSRPVQSPDIKLSNMPIVQAIRQKSARPLYQQFTTPKGRGQLLANLQRTLSDPYLVMGMTQNLASKGFAKIPKKISSIKELKFLAKEARKYKSAKEFAKTLRLQEFKKLGFREFKPEELTTLGRGSIIITKLTPAKYEVVEAMPERLRIKRIGSQNIISISPKEIDKIIKAVGKPEAPVEIQRTFLDKKLGQFGYKSLTDFYNQAVKGVKVPTKGITPKPLQEGGVKGITPKSVLGVPTSQLPSKLKGIQKPLQPEMAGGGQKPPIVPTLPTKLKQEIPYSQNLARERGFVKTMKESEMTPSQLKEKLSGEYIPISLSKEAQQANVKLDVENFVKGNYDQAKKYVLSGEFTAEKNLTGQELVRRSINAGKFDEANEIAQAIAEKGTTSGQAVKSFSAWNKTTPEGMLKYAQQQVSSANEKLGAISKGIRNVLGKKMPEIDAEDAKFITDTMKKSQGFTDDAKEPLIRQVMERIGKKIPWGVSDVIDNYRYNNMLSNPLTHLRNAISNLEQTFLVRPATLAVSGHPIQAVKYEIGALKSIPEAIKGFVNQIKNPAQFGRMDVPTKRLLGRYNTPSDLMEGVDIFFRKIIGGGEMARGATKQQAAKMGEYSLFRAPLNESQQGYVLNKIDDVTKAVYQLRKVGLGWFIPFIRTPMNVAKQWVEYSPMGFSTIAGATKKNEQVAKTILGSLATLAGAGFAMKGRVTWDAPTDPTQKQLFYASGRKPFSVKIGNKWIPMQSFGVFAFALGLPAAYKYYQEEAPSALTDGDIEKFVKVSTAGLNFWSQQTFVSGLGSFVKLMEGDQDYNLMRNISQVTSQLKPMTGVMTYIANLIDPIFRKPKGFKEQMKMGVPGMTQGLEPYTTPLGEPEKSNWTNYLLHYGAGQ